jgi:hypothetical protein
MSPERVSDTTVSDVASPAWSRLQAEDAIADGDVLRAIDVLTDANLREPDKAREQWLVQLRNEAVGQLVARTRPGRWPRNLADPFPGARLPEIAGDELSVELVGGGVLHHGAVLARGLIDPPAVARLIDCIDRALDAAAAQRTGTAGPDDEAWYAPFGKRELALGKGTEWVRVIDSPRATFEVTERLRGVGRGLVTEYLGERPVMSSQKWTLRRISPECGGEWHQDGRFLGDGVRVLNVWIALTRCGGGTPAPGLEVVPRRLDLLPTGSHGTAFDWTIGRPVVERAAAGLIVDPVYEPGDALVFDQRTVHRTGSRPGLTSSRHAIESWFFAPSTQSDCERTFVF